MTLFRVVEASKTSAKFLTDQKAKKIIAQLGANNSAVVIPEKLIELLKGMQDIEYPDADLLHTAIQNKFVKGLGICQVNKSNTLDINIIRLNEKDQKLLHEELKDIFPFISTRVLTHSLCNESDYEHIRAGYDTYIRPAVEALYREDMPAYKSMDIQWSGKQCGCVPKEMVTLAYGIYPYWSVTKETQNFDFSAFSRVAYRGFTFSDRGQLQQIRADNQAKTLLNSTDGHSAEFIHVARTYSGKVDWMIEKDWSHFAKAQSTEGQSPLTHALETVRGNIVNLLATPLDDPFAPLRPWLSLGFAGKPTNGDGVTLYFRHFTQTEEAKKEFDTFFIALKNDLNRLSQERTAYHQFKDSIYVNLVVTQADFTKTYGVFSRANLERLTGLGEHAIQNFSQIEMQERVKSLVIVLLNDPYYNSLDEIYSITSEATRSILVPVMFSSFKNMEAFANSHNNRQAMWYCRMTNL